MFSFLKAKLAKLSLKPRSVSASLHALNHPHQVLEQTTSAQALRLYMAKSTDSITRKKIKQLENPNECYASDVAYYILELKAWNARLNNPVLIDDTELPKMRLKDWFEVEAQLVAYEILQAKQEKTRSSTVYLTAIRNNPAPRLRAPAVLTALGTSTVNETLLSHVQAHFARSKFEVIFYGFAAIVGPTALVTVGLHLMTQLGVLPFDLAKACVVASVWTANALVALHTLYGLFVPQCSTESSEYAQQLLSDIPRSWNEVFSRRSALDCWLMAATYKAPYQYNEQQVSLQGLKDWEPQDAALFFFDHYSQAKNTAMQYLARHETSYVSPTYEPIVTNPSVRNDATVLAQTN